MDTLIKHTKDVRVFRRAQAVREVVCGHHIKGVSNSFHFTYSALRKWVRRFAQEGTSGLWDRPRPGRPRKVTEEVSNRILHLVDQTPCATAPCRRSGIAEKWC